MDAQLPDRLPPPPGHPWRRGYLLMPDTGPCRNRVLQHDGHDESLPCLGRMNEIASYDHETLGLSGPPTTGKMTTHPRHLAHGGDYGVDPKPVEGKFPTRKLPSRTPR